jgi:hypothetical protein
MRIVTAAGSGRSGSTLVGLVLAQDPSALCLGQTRHLWEAWAADAPCSCGRGLRACALWGQAVPEGLGSAAGAEAARAQGSALAALFAAAARLPDWGDPAAVRRLGAEHAGALAVLRRTLAAAASRAGAAVLVDTSKLPEMALAFELIPGASTRVLNLVRDPRAVAVSWWRREARPLRLWRNIRQWRSRQARLASWAPALGDRFRRLAYESFAARPAGEIPAMLAWAGLDPAAVPVAPGGAVAIDWGRLHLFPPANETVLAERRAVLRIRPSEGWRDPRFAWLHALVRLGAGGEGHRFYRGPARPVAPPGGGR